MYQCCLLQKGLIYQIWSRLDIAEILLSMALNTNKSIVLLQIKAYNEYPYIYIATISLRPF